MSNTAHEEDEWISAAGALALLAMPSGGSRAICKRAHAGMVRSRAELCVIGKVSKPNSEIPEEFWWAEGGDALNQNWANGDFDTWIRGTTYVSVFGVTFNRRDIEKMKPSDIQKITKVASIRSPDSVFIGHGRSTAWLVLKGFLQVNLKLNIEEFN